MLRKSDSVAMAEAASIEFTPLFSLSNILFLPIVAFTDDDSVVVSFKSVYKSTSQHYLNMVNPNTQF